MNKTLKKIITVASGLLLGTAAFAQNSAAPIPRFLPLLSGYNMLAVTNTTPGLGSTNVLFTKYNGQVLYSLTNNSINGVVNTNAVAEDAFQTVTLLPDANGDINANASLWVMIGNTNWIPVVVTNSVGQYFVTNNWLLASSSFPNWMNPATTNYYPTFDATETNVVTVTLYRIGTKMPKGGIGPDIQTSPQAVWLNETTSAFNLKLTANGVTPVCVSSNLPVAWLQGAKGVYATVSVATNGTAAGGQILVNQIGILQPQ